MFRKVKNRGEPRRMPSRDERHRSDVRRAVLFELDKRIAEATSRGQAAADAAKSKTKERSE